MSSLRFGSVMFKISCPHPSRPIQECTGDSRPSLSLPLPSSPPLLCRCHCLPATAASLPSPSLPILMNQRVATGIKLPAAAIPSSVAPSCPVGPPSALACPTAPAASSDRCCPADPSPAATLALRCPAALARPPPSPLPPDCSSCEAPTARNHQMSLET